MQIVAEQIFILLCGMCVNMINILYTGQFKIILINYNLKTVTAENALQSDTTRFQTERKI